MSSKETANWQDDTALERYTLIAPLLDPGLDQDKRTQMRNEIADKNGISSRTLYRYEKAYQENGFQGLKPMDRAGPNSSRLPDNYDELLKQAIQLKREVPQRSVATIIRILEMEDQVPPGVLKRSTLERHLYEAGFGVRQMQMYNDSRASSTKRFCKPHRMMLVQADIKYGPLIPAGKNGKMVKTYLSSLLDDHSRFILHSEFYLNQTADVVEDTVRKAILKWGKFDTAYMDNGSAYISKQLRDSLARLGMTIRHAPIQSGKSKGKIEVYHKSVSAFINEVKAQKIRTLEDLNHYWTLYLEEYYHKRPHSGIAEYYESIGSPVPEQGITPLQEWNRDSRPLTFLDVSVVAEAFQHHETRQVDKGACISFKGCKYETKTSLIGCTVEISYDPMIPGILTVHYKGMEPFTAQPVKIGEFCDKTPAIPASMLPEEPESSRFLTALEKKSGKIREQRADAISFGSYRKDGDQNV